MSKTLSATESSWRPASVMNACRDQNGNSWPKSSPPDLRCSRDTQGSCYNFRFSWAVLILVHSSVVMLSLFLLAVALRVRASTLSSLPPLQPLDSRTEYVFLCSNAVYTDAIHFLLKNLDVNNKLKIGNKRVNWFANTSLEIFVHSLLSLAL
jgi:hypothetical protein